MEIQVDVDGELAIVRLPAVSDLTIVTELHQKLIEQSGAHRQVVIEAGLVERMTTPCIQLLLAARRSFGERQQSLTLANPTEATRASFVDLGLSADFDALQLPIK